MRRHVCKSSLKLKKREKKERYKIRLVSGHVIHVNRPIGSIEEPYIYIYPLYLDMSLQWKQNDGGQSGHLHIMQFKDEYPSSATVAV